MTKTDIAHRIRQLIETRGLTQAQVSAKSGLPPATISHFVSAFRTPGTSTLRKLADALDVSVEYLLGRDEEPKVAGPTAKVIFRNAQDLSEDSLKILAEFSEMLKRRDEEKKKEE